ncbi:MFS transporter [Streptomyces sp. NPDC013157]|uniref:MFS transporter n=1 Tax=Streptomyces sp. NPDC013157 TaxID=3364861 RepID=UPI00369E464E
MSSGTVTPPVSRGLVPLATLLVTTQSYQIVVFPNFLHSLLAEPGWHLSPGGAGLVGSTVFLGILAGAVAAVPLARLLGRRRATLASILWLTSWSGAGALAAAPWQLGLLRMIAGIGMGVAFPLILSFLHDAAGRATRARGDVAARAKGMLPFVLVGMPIAGIITQNVAGALPVQDGWRLLTAMGAGLGIAALALSALLLPRGSDTVGLAPDQAGQREPSRRFIVGMGIGLLAVNLIAWSGLTGLRSADLRFNTALNAGAVVALVAISGVAIRRRKPRTPLRQTVCATLVFLLFNPATVVVTVVSAACLLAGQSLAFVMTLVGVWIADGYCRALAISVAPRVLYALPHRAVKETGDTAPVPQPLGPGTRE